MAQAPKKYTARRIFIMPPAEAHFPHLPPGEPDAYEQGGVPKFKCRVKLAKDDNAEGFVLHPYDKTVPRSRSTLTDAVALVAKEQWGSATGIDHPIKPFLDREGNSKAGMEDYVWVEGSAGTDYPPQVVGMDGKALGADVRIGNGDLVQLSLMLVATQTPKGRFVSRRLRAVRLIEKRANTIDYASEFGDEYDEPMRSVLQSTLHGGGAADFADDIPF